MPLIIEYTLGDAKTVFCGVFVDKDHFNWFLKNENLYRRKDSRIISEKAITQQEYDNIRVKVI
jgi:hypothetical protein